MADKKSLLTQALDYAFLSGEAPQFEAPEPEYHALGDRRRFDYAWPARKVLVEVHGGVFISGGHTRGSGFIADRQKMRSAAIDGWLVLEYVTTELEEDPIGCAKQLAAALEARKA
jgi:hypothetical protein